MGLDHFTHFQKVQKITCFHPLLAPYFEPFPFIIKIFTFIIQKPTTDTKCTWLTRDTNASYASLFHGGFWLLTENLRNIFNLRNLRYYVELVVCGQLALLQLTAQTAPGSTEDHSQLTVIIIIITIIIITTQTAPLRTTVNWLTHTALQNLFDILRDSLSSDCPLVTSDTRHVIGHMWHCDIDCWFATIIDKSVCQMLRVKVILGNTLCTYSEHG